MLSLKPLGLLTLLILTGCGFQPLHSYQAPGGASIEAALSSVAIGVIAEREGQMLRNHLIDRFAPSGAPAYRLTARVSESIGSALVARDRIATRRTLTSTATFTLVNRDGQTIMSGSESANTRFDVVDDVSRAFADVSAERAARRRAVRELADKITRRVGFALGRAAR